MPSPRQNISNIISIHTPAYDQYEATYKHIHSHPELSHCESETASLVQSHLAHLPQYSVKADIGGHGVVGILRNGDGPTVLLRADMDALPIEEKTGLDYASKTRMQDVEGIEKPVMHACGHDMHVTSLLAAAELLHKAKGEWSGTLIVCFQPAEERPPGAQAMIDDGMYTRHGVPKPDIALGGHVVGGAKAGTVGLKSGVMFLAGNSMKITFYGKGAHASQPHKSIDPVLMAASFVTRVQGIVSRELAWTEKVILTVASIQAGDADNVIPSEAAVLLTFRSEDERVRAQVLDAIRRIAKAESEASGATQEPDILPRSIFPVTSNDEKSTNTIKEAFQDHFGKEGLQHLTGPYQASEDFGILASAVGSPYTYWTYGSVDAETWEKSCKDGTEGDLPANHSAFFAPAVQPTLKTGVEALAVAALTYLRTDKV